VRASHVSLPATDRQLRPIDSHPQWTAVVREYELVSAQKVLIASGAARITSEPASRS
jgi:hypothetical protein